MGTPLHRPAHQAKRHTHDFNARPMSEHFTTTFGLLMRATRRSEAATSGRDGKL